MKKYEMIERILKKRKEFLLNNNKNLKITFNKKTFSEIYSFFISFYRIEPQPMMSLYGMNVDLIQNQKEDFIIEEFEQFQDPFENLIRRLLFMKWDFSIKNYVGISDTDEILKYLKNEHVGECIRVITFVIGNDEIFLHEYETGKIKKTLEALEKW